MVVLDALFIRFTFILTFAVPVLVVLSGVTGIAKYILRE